MDMAFSGRIAGQGGIVGDSARKRARFQPYPNAIKLEPRV